MGPTQHISQTGVSVANMNAPINTSTIQFLLCTSCTGRRATKKKLWPPDTYWHAMLKGEEDPKNLILVQTNTHLRYMFPPLNHARRVQRQKLCFVFVFVFV